MWIFYYYTGFKYRIIIKIRLIISNGSAKVLKRVYKMGRCEFIFKGKVRKRDLKRLDF